MDNGTPKYKCPKGNRVCVIIFDPAHGIGWASRAALAVEIRQIDAGLLLPTSITTLQEMHLSVHV